MTIRQAAPRDLAAVQAIVMASYAVYIPRIGKPPGPMQDDYADLIARGVVWVTGRPVHGLIVLLAAPDHLLLDNVAIHPDQQGKGTGRALLNFAEAQAEALGLAGLRLYTNAAMTENQSLYTHLGWRCTGRAMQAGFDRVFFSKAVRGHSAGARADFCSTSSTHLA